MTAVVWGLAWLAVCGAGLVLWSLCRAGADNPRRPDAPRFIEGRRVEVERTYVGWLATTEDYDGPPAPCAWGSTPEEAAENLEDLICG